MSIYRRQYRNFWLTAPLIALWHILVIGSPILLGIFVNPGYFMLLCISFIALVFGYGISFEESVECNDLNPAEIFLWITFAGFHHLYHQHDDAQHYNKKQRPKELKDDRLPFLETLLANIKAWDRDVHLINRLIDQVEFNLAPLADIEPLIAHLKDDEGYLLRQMAYAERLLEEGPLGTSIELTGSVEQLVDQVDDRFAQMDRNREDLRKLSGQIAARMEVSRLS